MGYKDSYQGHYSVLLNEVLDFMQPEDTQTDFVGIDCTLGEAGHTRAMMEKWPTMHVVASDVDADMLVRARMKLGEQTQNVVFHQAWFDAMLDNYADYPGMPVRVILMDLGLSMYHFVASGRGFSFSDEATLDMRLSGEGHSAEDIINNWPQDKLAQIFDEYGDEKEAYKMAKMIVAKRPFSTAKQLADAIYEHSRKKSHRIHPATKIFQAIRIAVNEELTRLQRALVSGYQLLCQGGKMGVISFHSLEDRIVKHFFRSLCAPCHCPQTQMICNCGGPQAKLVNPGGTAPTAQEVSANPASRSARLRVIQKIGGLHG